MRILITNNALDRRGGAEIYTRDLARALQTRGHQVMVFSSAREKGQRFLGLDPVPVIADLSNLEVKPDIIHGQHHLDLMASLTAMPGIPAVLHLHEAVWHEVPPIHPRIYRYLTITAPMKERLISEHNLMTDSVDVLPNGVDLTRFRTVRQAPGKPKRALIYHRTHREDAQTSQAIRESCRRHNISLDTIGYGLGRTIENSHELLLNYDLVFASSMSAIDAAASGCAVIILGRTNCGPMLTAENFDLLRAADFSIPADATPPDVGDVDKEIGKYSPDKTLEVTDLTRKHADHAQSVEQLINHYEETIQLHQQSEPDWKAESRSVSRYLQKIVPLIKTMDDSLTWDVGMPITMADALGDLQVQMARFQEQMIKQLQRKTTGVE
jgi:hypothetical protein